MTGTGRVVVVGAGATEVVVTGTGNVVAVVAGAGALVDTGTGNVVCGTVGPDVGATTVVLVVTGGVGLEELPLAKPTIRAITNTIAAIIPMMILVR